MADRRARSHRAAAYSALAAGYDTVMSHVDYPLWARYVHDLLMRHAPHTRDVLELGCGTGSFALALMKLSNYRYLATDRAEEMLEVARSKADREGAEIRFRKMDFLDFDLNQQFDAVVLLYDSLNYVLEPAAVSRVLENAHGVLRSDGAFIFDISTPSNSLTNMAYFEDRGLSDAFIYVRTSEYDPETRLHATHFELQIGEETTIEEHLQRAYSMNEIRDMIESRKWKEVSAYDGFSTAPATEETNRVHWVLVRS